MGDTPIGASIAFFEDMLESNVGNVYDGRGGDNGYLWTPVGASEKREMVDHPRHYNSHPSGVECIEICEHMTFNLGNAFKYGWRYKDKGDPVENLKKMLWYLNRSYEHDSQFLIRDPGFQQYFKTFVMNPHRQSAFSTPSPWPDNVRIALAAIVEMHATPVFAERATLYDKIKKHVAEAIAEQSGIGRGLAL